VPTERLSCAKGHDVLFGPGGSIAKIVGELRIKEGKQNVVIPSDQCSQCAEKEVLEDYDRQKKSRQQ